MLKTVQLNRKVLINRKVFMDSVITFSLYKSNNLSLIPRTITQNLRSIDLNSIIEIMLLFRISLFKPINKRFHKYYETIFNCSKQLQLLNLLK